MYDRLKRLYQAVPQNVLRGRPFTVCCLETRPQPDRRKGGAHEDAEADATAVTVREATETSPDLAALTDVRLFREWEGQRRRLWIAEHRKSPVGVVWVDRQRFVEEALGIALTLRDDEAWLFAAHVAPAWRRQGVYARLLHHVRVALHASGVRRIYLGVAWGNRASQVAHQRQGATPIGWLAALRCADCLQLAFCGGHLQRCRRLPWSFGSHPLTFQLAIPHGVRT